jgi:hypothetical protein
MKKLLLLIGILYSSISFSQTTNSWVQFVVQYDYYSPSESNFFMVEDTISGDTVIFHQPTQPYEVLDTIINLNSGNYLLTLTDNFGDGWISNQPAWFKMQNDCQGQIINYDPLTQVFFTLDTLVNILPCAPPTPGCTDVTATNYDSTATIDDGSCTYPPCGGFLTSAASQQCSYNGQALLIFNWALDSNVSCEPVTFHYWTPFNGPYQYGLNPNSLDFAVYAGTPNMPPNWSVPHFGQVQFADGSMSDTIFYTPYSCITGCTDSTAEAYNPWANVDDGSCSGTTCDPVTETQITIAITLDNWPTETGWTFTDGMGGTFNTPDGTYTFNDIGVTYTYTYCVSATGPFEFVLSDTYGDGIQGNGSPNSAGEVVIYDCDGDTITYLSGGTWVDGSQTPIGVDFGTVAYSTPLFGVACTGSVAIPGCLDPTYQEFNPLANVNDSSCINLHVFGCTDPTSFNYDASASIMDLVDTCEYTLTIEDGAGDGWGNSYIGVSQGTNTWTYTMGPGSYSQTFLLTLETDKPVTVYYFEVPNAQNPDPIQTQFQTYQNSFILENADDVILLDEGSNPFANNGQGALQGFGAPFWTTYSAMPYCGDYCIPAIYGCTDPFAFNYLDTANTDDGSCIAVIAGCTNSLAFNYDSLANTDDGSCVAEVTGCMDSTAFNYNPLANNNDPLSCIPVILGCMDDTMYNYNAAANTDDGGCIPIIFGCTDLIAFNYDSLANTNNGSCVPVILGCIDVTQFNFDPLANTNDGSCIPFIYGCMDATMWNYNPGANTDNNSCIPFIYGCTDSTQYNYDPLANADNNSCIPFIYGCTNPNALNYDAGANTDNGSCILPIYGCTDSTMFNYNPLANADNGTCEPFVYGCTNPNALNYNPLANTDDNSCVLPINGCTDSTMFNYNPLANVDNGSCIPFVYGCNDVTAFNYDPLANTSDNSCCYISGCMDATALNYDPNACYEPVNTCITAIPGCTDVAAYNYNPLANVSDSAACNYDAGCYGGPGIPYWLNDGCYAWVINVDDYCCTTDWDASCESLYDYCQLGWPTAIEDISALGIVVYPNPTKDIITIETRLQIEVELYDMMGKQVIRQSNIKRLDLSDMPNGLYNMIIIHNNIKYNKKVIKQ